MWAIIAAIAFGLALLLDLTGASLDVISSSTLLTIGLLCLALHLAPATRGRGWRLRR